MPVSFPTITSSRWVLVVIGIAAFAAGFSSNFRAGGGSGQIDSGRGSSVSAAAALQESASKALTSRDVSGLFDPTKPFASKAAITAEAMRLDATQLRERVLKLARDPDEALQDAVWPVLVARWAKLDPRGVLELAFEDGLESRLRRYLLAAGFPELVRVAPDDARGFALRIGSDGDNPRKEVMRSMLVVLAETDPTLALRWLDDRSLVPEKDYEEISGRFFAAWVEQNPAAAGNSALEHQTEWVVSAIAAVWVMVDPGAVAAWAIKLDSPELRGTALEEIIEATGDTDGGAFAMSLLDSFFPGETTGFSLSKIGRAAFDYDIDKGLSWLASIENDRERLNVGINTGYIVARDHPQRLADFLAVFQDERTRRKVIERLAESWARSDTEAAIAWARTLETATDREAALFNLVKFRPELIAELESPAAVHHNDTAKLARQMNAANGMAATQAWIDGLPSSSQRNAALGAMYTAWTDEPLAAIEFLGAFDSGGRPETAERWRRTRIERFVSEWGKDDLAVATAWAVENGYQKAANELRGRAVLEVLETGDHELAAAQLHGHISQLSELPEGVARHADEFYEASAKISHRWARRDPVAASAWVGSINDHQVRNMAAYQVAKVWADADPQAALEWGLGLPAGKAREQVLRGTFDAWAGSDTGSARAALDAAGLGESERAIVLEEFPK